MHGFGGMVAFTLADDNLDTAKAVVANTKLFTLAGPWAAESLIGHPATMTHASIPKEVREKTGVTDGLIRLRWGWKTRPICSPLLAAATADRG